MSEKIKPLTAKQEGIVTTVIEEFNHHRIPILLKIKVPNIIFFYN
ncbi:MAG: hypothetical protein AAGB12_01725 [Pseudomonadota bacterium]